MSVSSAVHCRMCRDDALLCRSIARVRASLSFLGQAAEAIRGAVTLPQPLPGTPANFSWPALHRSRSCELVRL